jgi:hypothetical protein
MNSQASNKLQDIINETRQKTADPVVSQLIEEEASKDHESSDEN